MPDWPLKGSRSEEVFVFCREWENNSRCGRRATGLIWGKLFAKEALGPRCDDHFEKWVGRSVADAQMHGWAIFDLRNLTREVKR